MTLFFQYAGLRKNSEFQQNSGCKYEKQYIFLAFYCAGT